MIVEYHRTHFDHFLLFTGPGLLIEAHPTAALPTAIQSPALGPVPGLDRTHDQSAAPALVHALALIPSLSLLSYFIFSTSPFKPWHWPITTPSARE